MITDDFKPEPSQQLLINPLQIIFRQTGFHTEQGNFRVGLRPPLQGVAHEIVFLRGFEIEPLHSQVFVQLAARQRGDDWQRVSARRRSFGLGELH
ncbi:hypothetical protein D3C81_1094040 [compost metagenome]